MKCGYCEFWKCGDRCDCKCHVAQQDVLSAVCNSRGCTLEKDHTGMHSREVPYGPTGKRVCYDGVPSHPLVPVEVSKDEFSHNKHATLEMEVRKHLWLGHGHPLTALYGDDGEMQCGLCQLFDYKRADIYALLSQAVANLREQHACEVIQAHNQGREQGIAQMRAIQAAK